MSTDYVIDDTDILYPPDSDRTIGFLPARELDAERLLAIMAEVLPVPEDDEEAA